jgi:proline dehydrogenase
MLPLVKTILRPLAHRLIAKASRGYVSGETLKDALSTSEQLLGRGYLATLAYWNYRGEAPADVISTYLATIEEVGKTPEQYYLSIKALAFDFDKVLYKTLLNRAREVKVALHFDALSHDTADETFSLISKHTPPPYNDIGCTLPGRWKRSLADAEWATSLGVVVRVVKGQWPDPDNPDSDPGKGFLAVVRELAGKAPRARIATHDPELAEQAISILQKANTSCELELLYGLPVRKVLPIAKKMNVPTRLYIPYGYGWIPYTLDKVRSNPKVLWWLFKDSLLGSYIERFPRR